MDKQRQRKLAARARRQAALHPEGPIVNNELAKNNETKVEKVDVRQTVAKSVSEPKKNIDSGTRKKDMKDAKKKHNSKGRK